MTVVDLEGRLDTVKVPDAEEKILPTLRNIKNNLPSCQARLYFQLQTTRHHDDFKKAKSSNGNMALCNLIPSIK